MKAIRTYFNVILTAIIGFLLPSCHAQKGVTQDTPKEAPKEKEHYESNRHMRVLYGIPPEVYEMREQREREAREQAEREAQAEKDSTAVSGK